MSGIEIVDRYGTEHLVSPEHIVNCYVQPSKENKSLFFLKVNLRGSLYIDCPDRSKSEQQAERDRIMDARQVDWRLGLRCYYIKHLKKAVLRVNDKKLPLGEECFLQFSPYNKSPIDYLVEHGLFLDDGSHVAWDAISTDDLSVLFESI